MKNRARSHEVEPTGIDRPFDDVLFAELNARRTGVIDKREIEIDRNDLTIGSHVPCHPSRH